VDVTDDKVFIKDADTIMSDHVEIWLADPRLTDVHKKSLATLQDMMKKLSDALANKDEDVQNLRESVTFTLNQMKTLKKMYVNNKYYTQLILNKKTLLSYPPEISSKDIYYEYSPTNNGYELIAKIPLNATCDYKSSVIGKIKYLIDVVDIDQIDSTSQKTLISSSNARIYSKPDTFNTLDFKEPYYLPLSSDAGVNAKILSNGYLKAMKGSYEYYSEIMNTFFGGIFLDNFDYPGFFKPMVMDSVSTTKELNLFCHGTNLIISNSKKDIKNIEFSNNAHVEGNAKCKILFNASNSKMHYAILEVTGSSRHFQGSGQCGAGEEASIIWIGIGRDFNNFVIDSFPFLSCLSSIDTDEHILDSAMLQIKTTDFQNKKIRIMKYQSDKPEKGLIISEQPFRKPAPQNTVSP
jgi:hypothetical protein